MWSNTKEQRACIAWDSGGWTAPGPGQQAHVRNKTNMQKGGWTQTGGVKGHAGGMLYLRRGGLPWVEGKYRAAGRAGKGKGWGGLPCGASPGTARAARQ